MSDKPSSRDMPAAVAAFTECGYAIWANDQVKGDLRDRFDSQRIPVVGVRHVRVWGLQVDDERAFPGLERTSMPDDEIWEINLRAKDGTTYEFDSRLLRPAAKP